MKYNATEQDTFDALRRAPFKVVKAELEGDGGYNRTPHDEVLRILKKHNWKLSEYVHANRTQDRNK